jgi:hypothetical protein
LCCNVDVDVPLSGSGSAGPAILARLEDSVAGSLISLSTPEIRLLLTSIDTHRFSHDAIAIPEVAGHDTPHALAALSEYVTRHPEHAAALLTTPALAPIHAEVREMVHQVTEVARTEAVRLVSTASLVVGATVIFPQPMDGSAVLAVATRFIETGQLANYYRAADLGQALITAYTPRERILIRRKLAAFASVLWRRAPLLALLLGWLAVGLAGALMAMLRLLSASTVQAGFELWGLGFLALVVFQFYVTTRKT